MISLIWAMGKNRCIGINNTLPWKLKADMKRFVQVTTGKPVIMGRKTYESIGKPLPNRTNIVLTKAESFQADGCIIAHTEEDAIAKAGNVEEIMIIGGAQIYKQFLPKAKKLYITEIQENFEGDSFFPEFDLADWEETERIENKVDSENNYDYTFLTLQRK